MAKLKIRNFGPIQNGFSENDGFLEISPDMLCHLSMTKQNLI